MYYNIDEKESFMSTLPKTGNYKVFFNTFAPFEEELNKDIGEMSRGELAYCLSHMDFIVYSTVENYISMAKQYLTWYAARHPGVVNLETVQLNWHDVDLSDNFRAKLITCDEEITNEFSDYRPEDGHYIVPVFLLAFHGVNLKTACRIKREDVICNGSSVRLIDGNDVIKIESAALSDSLTRYMNWEGTKFETASSIYRLVPDRNGMLLSRRLRDDDFNDYPPLDGKQVVARLYQIRTRVAGGHEFKYNIGECKVSGQYLRLCKYYNEHGEWPGDKEITKIVGKKMRDGYDIARVIGGAELYKQVFNL